MTDTAVAPVGWLARMRDRLPRTLSPTRSGRWLLALTMGAGFAAINTGNNLLFLGWGLMLASILISGLLSEGTLRGVRLSLVKPPLLRAGRRDTLTVEIHNVGAQLAAYAVKAEVSVRHGGVEVPASGYCLRLAPGGRQRQACTFVPPRRGVYRVGRLFARTRFPFGFFEKSRRFDLRPLVEVVAGPADIDLREDAVDRLVRRGDIPSGRRGAGEEFFSLKLYREGDDRKKVHWRRSARLGRWLVRETEEDRSDDVVLVANTGGGGDEAELCLRVVAKLAEQLLAQGRAVGLRGPGFAVKPATGGRTVERMLVGLGRCDPEAPLAPELDDPVRELWICADAVRDLGDRGVLARDLVREMQ